MLVWAAGLHGSSATQLLPWPGAGLCCAVSMDIVVTLDTVSHMQQYTFVFPYVLYNHLWQWPCSNFDQRNKTNLLRCIVCILWLCITHMLDKFSVKKCKQSNRQKYSRSRHTRESSSCKIFKKLLFIQRSKWNFQENMVCWRWW